MNAGDLFFLQNVKDWLATDGKAYPSASDAILQRLVSAASAFAGSYLQRTLQPTGYSEVYNGFDTTRLMLRRTPILSVSSLVIGTSAILPRAAPGQAGFAFDANMLYLEGSRSFCRGVQNIAVAYRAGLQQSDTLAVPSSPYTIGVGAGLLSKPWNSDQGVAYASTGIAFTRILGSPSAAGTYQVGADAGGVPQYVFSSSDAAASVAITYGYTPGEIVQALIELVGERYKVRSRVGQNSQNLGHGQVVSFSQKDLNATAKLMLAPWRNVVPVE